MAQPKKSVRTKRKVKRPVARRFSVQLPPNTTSYVDTAAILSRINQRLLRQGMGYHIGSVELAVTGTGYRYAKIETLPHNWFVANAHKLAFNAWMQSHEHERKNGVKTPQWSDFKVFFDDAMVTGTVLTSPLGLSNMTQGEWRYTTAATEPSGNARAFWMLGAASGATGFNMVAEYDGARNTRIEDDQPAMVYDAPYDDLLAELVQEQADYLRQQGDQPPYESVSEVNNLITPTWEVFNGNVSGGANQLDDKSKEYGIYAPCGLLRITTIQAPTAGDPMDVVLTIEVKSGDYKGVAGELMY